MMAYIFGPCGKEKVYYDIGFHVESRRGITPIGKLVVRVAVSGSRRSLQAA